MPFFTTTSKEDTSFVSASLLAIALLFLLFPCISTPVVDPLCMYRLSTQIEGAIRYVDVGFWGSCVEPLKITGYNKIVFDPNVHERCTKSAVGLQLDENVANALHAPQLEGMHNKAHTGLLVLHPITMAFITFSCIFQTIVYLATRRGNRSILRGMTSNYVTWMFCYSSLTTFLILFAFIVQISVVVYAKIYVAAIRSTVGEVSFHLGNTIWLSLVAVILHVVELGVLFFVRRKLRKEERDADITKVAEAISKKEKRKAARRAQKAKKGEEGRENAALKEDENIPSSHPPAYALSVTDPLLERYSVDGELEDRPRVDGLV